MARRKFKIGDVCVHKGFICRVDAVKRDIPGVTRSSLAYMGFKDGTELNPDLTLTALYGPDGEPVVRPKPRKAIAGNVEHAQQALKDTEAEVARLQKHIALLKELTQ